MCLLVMLFGVTYIALSKIFYPRVIKHYCTQRWWFILIVMYFMLNLQFKESIMCNCTCAAPMSLQVDVPLVFQCLDSSLEVPFWPPVCAHWCASHPNSDPSTWISFWRRGLKSPETKFGEQGMWCNSFLVLLCFQCAASGTGNFLG